MRLWERSHPQLPFWERGIWQIISKTDNNRTFNSDTLGNERLTWICSLAGIFFRSLGRKGCVCWKWFLSWKYQKNNQRCRGQFRVRTCNMKVGNQKMIISQLLRPFLYFCPSASRSRDSHLGAEIPISFLRSISVLLEVTFLEFGVPDLEKFLRP